MSTSAGEGVRAVSYRWVILAVSFFSIFIGTVSQFQVAGLAYRLIPALHLTPMEFYMVFSAPMLPPFVFSIFGGGLADRYGVKTIVTVAFVVSVIGSVFRYAAHDFVPLFILSALAGVSSALLVTNIAKLLGAWFPRAQFGTAMGIFFAGSTIGMSVGLATAPLFGSTTSAFVTAGLVMLLIGILWVALVREKPAGAPDVPAMPVTKYIGVAARSWNVWLVGILLLFFMGSLVTLSGQLADGLHAARGVNPVTAGVLASLVTLATAAGSLIGPAVADRVGWLKPFLVPVGILGALAIYGAWVAPLGAPVTILLILVGLFYGTMQPILIEYPMLLPEIGHTYAGSASGIAMTLFGAGAFFVPSFVMAPLAGSDYTLLFVLAALALLLVALGSGLLPELGRRAAPPRRREAAAAPQPGGPGVGHPL